MRKTLAFVVAVVGGVVGSLLGYRIGGFVGAIAGLCVGYSVCFGMVWVTSGIMRDVRDIPSLFMGARTFVFCGHNFCPAVFLACDLTGQAEKWKPPRRSSKPTFAT